MITELIIGKHSYHIAITNESDPSAGIWTYYSGDITRSTDGKEFIALTDPEDQHEDYGLVEGQTYWECLERALSRIVNTEATEEHIAEQHAYELDIEYLAQREAEEQAQWEEEMAYIAQKSRGVL